MPITTALFTELLSDSWAKREYAVQKDFKHPADSFTVAVHEYTCDLLDALVSTGNTVTEGQLLLAILDWPVACFA